MTAVAQPVGVLPSRIPVAVSSWLLAFVAVLPLAVARAGVLTESDTFWQVRAGLRILDEGRIPTVDSFSWTAAGEPWTLNSWGFDVLAALIYRVAGLPGVAVFGAVGVAAIFALLLVVARRLGAAPAVAGGVVFLVAPLLVGWLSVRPQLVDYAAVLVLGLLLRRLADAAARPARTVALVGLVAVVWVNLHAAALLGVAVSGAAVAAVLLRRSTRPRWGRFVAAFLACTGGALLNPYGVGVFAQGASVQGSSAAVVTEWQHLNLLDPVQALLFGLAVTALVAAGRRSDLLAAAALAVCCAGSVVAVRFLPVAAVVAVPVIAAALSRPVVLRYLQSRRVVFVPAAVAAVTVMVAVAAAGVGHVGQPNPGLYPQGRVVASVPAGCRVFNSYPVGGFLLLERPDLLVSVDSRNDLYGPARVAAGEQIVESGSAVPAGAGCVVVPPKSGLAVRLRSDSGWSAVTEDQAAAVFRRR